MIKRQEISAYIFTDFTSPTPTVYFSEDHRHDPQTASALARLLRSYPKLCFEPVPLDQLRQRQSSSEEVSEDISRSEQQSRVIRYFKEAVRQQASDIHLLIGYQGITLVQLRVHGKLRTLAQLERDEGMQLAATIILSMCDVTEKALMQIARRTGGYAVNLFGN